MQSLYLFLKEKKLAQGFRLSLENFSRMEQISILPVYAVNNLKDNLKEDKFS
jgi:hypothetical protein